MQCPKCYNQLGYAARVQVTHCIVCGTLLELTPREYLTYPELGLAREVRPGQLQLTDRIDINVQDTDKTILIVNGGTGIGKSYAYLVPLILSGQKFIVSTSNKTLQGQLIEKDVPAVCKALQTLTPKRVVLLKGRSNYLCLRSASRIPTSDSVMHRDFVQKCIWDRVPGDFTNWPGPDLPVWWGENSSEQCVGRTNCIHGTYCRPRTQGADIIVCNHALAALMATKLGYEFVDRDNPPEVVVYDEAHQLEKYVRDQCTLQLSKTVVARLYARVTEDKILMQGINDWFKHCDSDRDARIEIPGVSASHTLAQGLRMLSQAVGGVFSHLYRTMSPKSGRDLVCLPADIPECYITQGYEAISYLRVHLRRMLHPDAPLTTVTSGMLKAVRYLKRLSSRLYGITAGLESIDPTKTNIVTGGYVYTLSSDGVLKSIPIHIGATLAKGNEHLKTQIYLSATMDLGDNFEYNVSTLGLDRYCAHTKIDTLNVVSPFNYATQVKLYLPTDVPFPARSNPEVIEKWQQAVANQLERLLVITKGKALVLFASNADLEAVLEFLDEDRMHAVGLKIITQSKNAPKAVREYCATPNGVLFGVASLWEGLDMPGDALRMVIIPRLPLLAPDDPLLVASKRKHSGPHAFENVTVPLVLTSMLQGCGRLIRTKTDIGILAILDSRIYTGAATEAAHNGRLATRDYKRSAAASPATQPPIYWTVDKKEPYTARLLRLLRCTSRTNSLVELDSWWRSKTVDKDV